MKNILKIFCVVIIILLLFNDKTNVQTHESDVIIYFCINNYSMDDYMILQYIDHL